MLKIVIHPTNQGSLWIARAPESVGLEGQGATKVEAILQLRTQVQQQLTNSFHEKLQGSRSHTVKA